jgi:hypothetical protein
MERYYFFKTDDKYRKDERKLGVISFHLKALYSEVAFSKKHNKEVFNFKYFDNIDITVNTKVHGSYIFDVETGVNGCCGESATTTKELYAQLNKFRKISEQDYFRMRALALRLMFRHTQFFNISNQGTNAFAYSRPWSYGLHKVKISVHKELINSKDEPSEFLEWLTKEGFDRYEVANHETIEIFINKDNNKVDRPYRDASFKIRGQSSYGRHASFQEAHKRTFWNDDFMIVAENQYQRARKVLMKMIFDSTELDISSLKKEQTYSVTNIIE